MVLWACRGSLRASHDGKVKPYVGKGCGPLSARDSDRTLWTFVRLDTDDGRRGWGEATLQGHAPAVHDHVARLAPALIGRNTSLPLDVMDIVGTCAGDLAEAAAISKVAP